LQTDRAGGRFADRGQRLMEQGGFHAIRSPKCIAKLEQLGPQG